jgi:hypothetical protein
MEQVGDDAAALATRVSALDPLNRDLVAAIARVASQDPKAGMRLLERSAWNVDQEDPLARRQSVALILQGAETASKELIAWGSGLMMLKTRESYKRDPLLEGMAFAMLRVEQNQPGRGLYNLSCLEAWQGNVDEALHWLRAAASFGQKISRAQIAAEKAFDRIREDPAFAAYVQSLPEN